MNQQQLRESVTTFAQTRTMERALGTEEETHRLYLLLDDGRTEEIGNGPDAYEVIERAAVKLKLGLLENIKEAAGVIMENPAYAAQAQTMEEAQHADKVEVIITSGHNGATLATFIASRHEQDAHHFAGDDMAEAMTSGQMADTMEKIALCVLMARAIVESQD